MRFLYVGTLESSTLILVLERLHMYTSSSFFDTLPTKAKKTNNDAALCTVLAAKSSSLVTDKR